MCLTHTLLKQGDIGGGCGTGAWWRRLQGRSNASAPTVAGPKMAAAACPPPAVRCDT